MRGFRYWNGKNLMKRIQEKVRSKRKSRHL